MNTDSYFAQGTGHTVCQDYALASRNARFGFAVVCDGCSASPRSEVGAGILAHTFVQAYLEATEWNGQESNEYKDIFEAVLKSSTRNRLLEIKRHTGLDINSFDATLVAAITDQKTQTLKVYIWGDGHVYLKFKGEDSLLLSARYASNAPYYFSYGLNQERMVAYEKQFGSGEAVLSRNHAEGETIKPYYNATWPLDVIEYVSVFSDGIETFSQVKDDVSIPIPLTDILPQVSQYKSTVGSFVQRRLTRFQKENREKLISHFDDISSASIIL